MAEYLTKEEIKQWRSSLEKITLEEFAQRLGKQVADSRPTNDMIDIVYNGENVSRTTNTDVSEKFSKIADRVMERERQLSHTPFSIKTPQQSSSKSENTNSQPVREVSDHKKIVDAIERVIPAEVKSEINIEEKPMKSVKPAQAEAKPASNEDINIVLKKNLTDREQMVFDYLLERRNTIVYAKDLATLLDLPRDYIYKYIKNLRAKIEGDKLVNAEKGGFILKV